MWLKFPAVAKEFKKVPETGLVATLGNFDGIHLGHQSLLEAVKAEASIRQLRCGLITFSPHPAKLIRGGAPKRLTKFRQIVEIAKSKGINDLIVLRFNWAMSQLEPEQFVDDLLIKKYQVKHLVIGPYARIGKNRKGTAEWILNYFQQKGLSATMLQPFSSGSERVSSNLIRECISKGELEHASQLLGRPFSISSKVVSGDSRGRLLGFPTANLDISNYVKPPYGVYFCKAKVEGKTSYTLANFGIRPTFDGKKEVLEAFLMDYQGPELYRKRMDLALLKQIREERHFDSSQALKNQIESDIKVAKELIETKSFN